MLEVDAALQFVLDRTPILPTESVVVDASALRRIVAQDYASDIDSPPFDKSIMDGYALRSSDAAPGAALTVIEEVAAGRTPTKIVGVGHATRVMTGAPIPSGADAVIPHEETELAGNIVRLKTVAKPGQHILTQGREMRAGEVVVPAGTRVTPAVVGLLAAIGQTSIWTYRKPVIAIISTGDELVDPSEKPGASQIRNSNGAMLVAQAADTGADVRYLGIARDEPDVLSGLVREALENADIVLLSGGVSAGKFDFVPDVLRQRGVEAHFHKVRMKPGKPLLFGTRERTLVFGLPGNPVSSFVCFELFVRPALRKMAGEAIPSGSFVATPLAVELKTRNDRPTYLPGQFEITPGGRQVRASAWFGSADLRGLLKANALIRVDAGELVLPKGTLVPALALEL